VANALALLRSLGKASLLITMTTNPKWLEINDFTNPSSETVDADFLFL